MTANALVMGLILYRIIKVHRLHDQSLGTTFGSTLRPVVLVVIESGMALFSIQLLRVVMKTVATEAASQALPIIISIHQMLNVITTSVFATCYFTDNMGLAIRE